METFILLCHGTSLGLGPIHDPTIENSELMALIRETYRDLQLPLGMGGCIKLHQYRSNPDLFFLSFYSNVHSEVYHIGKNYTASNIAFFERVDFEDFKQNEHQLRERLQQFAHQLLNGTLQSATD